jgi:site-specific DNA-methyltransferase (cytosine-N4-specific)
MSAESIKISKIQSENVSFEETSRKFCKARMDSNMPSHIAEIFSNKYVVMRASYSTNKGLCFNEDSLLLAKNIKDNSINLILTSPPFALTSPKEYGNKVEEDYVEWFIKFLYEFKRIITKDGSIVIDFGSAYLPGNPIKSVYQYEILLRACKEVGLFLSQEFFHYNPARLPSPAEWVNVRRVRVKDSVNLVWWFSKSEMPKANNKNILIPYTDAMKQLIQKGYKAKERPSGHNITNKFQKDNGGAIPPNLLTLGNNDSNSVYIREMKKMGRNLHPARFPKKFAEFFIKFLTEDNDIIFDPFSGSNTSGYVAEELNRRWIASDLVLDYVKDSAIRFQIDNKPINLYV